MKFVVKDMTTGAVVKTFDANDYDRADAQKHADALNKRGYQVRVGVEQTPETSTPSGTTNPRLNRAGGFACGHHDRY